MSDKFYITTPIYYSNDIPHIGHAYSSLIADTFARFYRLEGYDVKFTTGVDENSQKVVEKAEEKSMSVAEYADMMAGKHREVWDGIGIEYTDFVRTTDDRHREFVQKVLQKSFDNGDIYE
jgi:methionyl-tRNA synthetase